ncbi:MAG: RAMP superfamily CRISPR-associated protein [candidate division KSB1 bacterium]|nr:RAMP superfamily CRISPR-associated protein [candidate division KSB1 bacterium]MDZ7365937.1 RAMP superfamily CRISPR-associated protein [candidate division KSB1 bacterium]MDZ7403829.1 RAMP superfamily CRISPR-associated protein [candidate division KSB1 bacterium]
MPLLPIEIRFTVALNRSFAIGTGFRRGLVHRTIERDADGYIYIPASTLKGKAREAAGKIAQQMNLEVCQSVRPDSLCSSHKGMSTCLVCRTFGSPGRMLENGLVGLYWRDAHLAERYRQVFKSDLNAQMTSRTQVQLSRSRGVAAEDHLFTSEVALEGLVFDGSVHGRLDATPLSSDSTESYELLLLILALKMVAHLGGGKSRGSGSCIIELEQVKANHALIEWKALLKKIDQLGNFSGGKKQ